MRLNCCCSLTTCTRAGGCAGTRYLFLAQKERDRIKYGLQEIDRSLGFADPWGTRRAALNEWDPDLPKVYRGNYLHGRERAGNMTAGCICDRGQTVLDAIFAINHRVTPRVKAVVTDGPPRSGDARPGPYVVRP